MDSTEITSTANPRVRAWVSLTKRSERDRTGLFLVEGAREVRRLRGRAEIQEHIWCGAYASDPPPVGATRVSSAVFDRLSRRQHPDGTAAIAATPDSSLDGFSPNKPELVLVADGIEKPGNIGAILRTCDALGASFMGSGLGTDLVNPNVVRAAQGSLFASPTASADRASAIAWCTDNTQVIVTRPSDSVSLWTVDLTAPVSIIVGAEDVGVAPEWKDVGTGVSIPMSGAADSLNASVTAAVLLAEAQRQRSV